MDTIIIDANAANEKEGKKKGKINLHTAAAVGATAAAGIAVGATISSLSDSIDDGNLNDTATASQQESNLYELSADELAVEAEDEPVIEVNPDDIMIEELIIAEVAESEIEPVFDQIEPEHQPFASNDRIDEHVMIDEVLVAEDITDDVIYVYDDPVDLICDMPYEQPIDFDEPYILEDTSVQYDEPLLADTDMIDSIDLQTDLLV